MESTPTPVAVQKAQAALDDPIPTKFTVSLGIFLLSLLAVSFPTLSKRVRFLRIPSIVFFLGKHFGTGVILSTAFVHLLPDAFKQLQSRWTGLIILLSLLSIFLVEYISTAYVDHLHSYSSAPPSPTPSIRERSHSHSHSHSHLHAHSHSHSRSHSPSSRTARDEDSPLLAKASPNPSAASERTPLLLQQPGLDSAADPHKASHAHADEPTALVVQPEPAVDTIFGTAHHRFETRGSHAAHSGSKRVSAVALFDEEGRLFGQGDVVGEVPLTAEGAAPGSQRAARRERRACAQSHGGHGHGHGHGHGGHFHLDMGTWRPEDEAETEEDEEPSEEVRVGRRRQVVGILMLQLGIMLHSLVIGLTLSITKGPEFTTLVTAILFHQLFEGLSLGIRIAALPSAPAQGAFAALPGHVLKPVLTVAFALTVPAGIAAGLLGFVHAGHDHAARAARLQGLMSAMSAGMLVYAACVEMLAGDFVMDPMMWRSGLARQAGALLSLAAGVCAMAFIGH